MAQEPLVHGAPLEDTAQQLQQGLTEPGEHLDQLLDRVNAVDSDVEALLAEPDRPGRIQRELTCLENRFPGWDRPSLYGVPVGVKDIFHVDGFPTRAGSEVPPAALAAPEASVVSRLKDAGAVVLGKTVTTEFAYFEPGPTRNPHDLARTPGGSSSGSAAAVAAGLCPLALGSQTIGSTIRPASFCGITGFKPTYGRIPIDGVLPLAASVDTVGLFTQDITGMIRAASVVCDGWGPPPPEQPVLGVPDGPYLEQASPEGLEEFERLITVLDQDGFDIHRVDLLEDIQAVNQRHNDLVAAEAAIAHHAWYEAHGDRYREGSIELVEEGREVTTETLARGRASCTELRDELTERMTREGIDVWVSPAAPGPAPTGIDSTGDPAMNLPWTHAGLPAVSLPVGQVNGLPFGLQCAARYGADEALLAWGEKLLTAFERTS